MHVLEAGFETKGRPCLLLLHGFPELAYSWRKVMPALAEAGYHVIAPDQRGYGRTTGWDADYDGDLASFRLLNLVRDALGLVSAFGYRSVDAVIGHDFGSLGRGVVRAGAARRVSIGRADERAVRGPAATAVRYRRRPPRPKPEDPVHRELAALPRPRKHYQWYYSTREANADMHRAPQGVHDFLRAYYHHKSADWKDNKPYPLKSWTAGELAKLPTYYVMDLAKDMAETVAEEMPSAAAIAANQWLPDRELSFYSAEYARTGFQGGLQWYRCGTSGAFIPELQTFPAAPSTCPPASSRANRIGAPISAPACYEAMQSSACTDMIGCHLIDGAGHWVQQEQPAEVSRLLLQFLKRQETGRAKSADLFDLRPNDLTGNRHLYV